MIKDVVRASMDPILVNMIGQCIWDEKLWGLTTPEDAENEKLQAMEDAAWYNDEFGNHMVGTSKKEKMTHANKEALDELHCDHSYKTIHQKKGNQLDVAEGEAFKIGIETKPMEIDSNEEDGEEVDYTNLSSEELIALLKKHEISPKGTVGSQPNSEC